ncbi:MAG: zinc-dependent alcohol dehydrogenase family protein [Calditrichia bacterium]
MMRAVVVKKPGGLDNLRVVDKPDPMPGPGEVLVEWRATSLNYHDYLVALGTIPVEDGLVPMSDGAGKIIGIGPEVNEWKVGDRVMSLFFPDWQIGGPTQQNSRYISGESVNGCAVEKAALPASILTRIPENYSYAEAATLPCAALTAWRALMWNGKLKPGDSVLIEGSGGMSIFALQFAKSAGAQVFATSSSNEKAETLMKMGAEAVVNYRDDEKWGKTINKLSGGGVDHVLDVGGAATWRQSVEAVRVGGNLCSIGILGGPVGEVLFPKLFFKHITVFGIAVGSREMQKDMVKALNVSDIRPVIDRRFKLENLADAFRYQGSGAHFGKIVVEY